MSLVSLLLQILFFKVRCSFKSELKEARNFKANIVAPCEQNCYIVIFICVPNSNIRNRLKARFVELSAERDAILF